MKNPSFSLYSFLRVLSFGLFFLMTGVVFWQVIARYFLSKPLDWSSELAKILMIWITFLGIVLAFYDRSHPNITFLVDKFPAEQRRHLEFALNVLLLFSFIVVTVMGVLLCIRTQNKSTTVLKLPMYVQYSALPVCTAIMSCKLIGDFAGMLSGKTKGGDQA